MIEFGELNFRRALSRFAAGIVQCSLPVAFFQSSSVTTVNISYVYATLQHLRRNTCLESDQETLRHLSLAWLKDWTHENQAFVKKLAWANVKKQSAQIFKSVWFIVRSTHHL